MNPQRPRIVATAVLDERTGDVVVAGQLLLGRNGVEGMVLVVVIGDRTFRATTGPHGSFGVRCTAADGAPASIATVQLESLRATVPVH